MSVLSDAIFEMRVVVLSKLLRKQGVYQDAAIRIIARDKSDHEVVQQLMSLRRRSTWWASIFQPREREILRRLENGDGRRMSDSGWPEVPHHNEPGN